MPRLTGDNVCVVCFCQDPKQDHVDFDAATDRGWYAQDTPNPVPLDQLIICEACLKAGAGLVDMVDKRPFEQDIKDKDARIDRLERELRQSRTFADNLESALAVDPHGREIDHRKRPRQIKEQVA